MPVSDSKGVKGFQLKAAFQIESDDLGIAGVPGIRDQLTIISESMADQPDYDDKVFTDGVDVHSIPVLVGRGANGEVRLNGYYCYLDLLALVLGKSHINSPIAISDGFKHYFEPDCDMASRPANAFDVDDATARTLRRRGTLVLDKKGQFSEFKGQQVSGMTLEASPSGIYFSFNLTGRHSDVDSLENSDSSTWTIICVIPILFTELSFYIKPRDEFFIIVSNDNFIWEEDSGTGPLNFDVGVGAHTPTQLAKEIQEGMNSHASAVNIYEVTYDYLKRRFKIKIVGGDFDDFHINTCQIEDEIGMPGGIATDAYEHESTVPCRVNADVDFTVSHKINITNLRLSVINHFRGDEQDSVNGYNTNENYLTGRSIDLNVEIPRLKDGEFLLEAINSEVYECLIAFDGPLIDTTDYYQLYFYLPQILITGVDQAAGGPQKIIKNLTAKAVDPLHFFNFRAFLLGEYYCRITPSITTGHEMTCITPHDGELYGIGWNPGAVLAAIYKLTQTGVDWVTVYSGSTIQQKPYECTNYFGWLFIGCASGYVYIWDGTSIVLSRTMSDDIVAFCQYGDDLYVLDNSGRLDKKARDGTWSTITSLSASAAANLVEYKGNLYFCANVSTDARVYKYDGTSVTMARSSGVNTQLFYLCKYLEFLVFGFNVSVHYYDNSSWITLGGTFEAAGKAIAYGDKLIHFPSGSTKDLWQMNILRNTQIQLYADFDKTMCTLGGLFKIFNGKLFIPINGEDSVTWLDPLKSLTVKTQCGSGANSNPILSAGQAGVFSPNQISDLEFWVDAQDHAMFDPTNPSSSQQIDGWLDKSGNGFDVEQLTSGQRPRYYAAGSAYMGGLPCVWFDGIDDNLENASCLISGGGPRTIFITYECQYILNNRAIICDGAGTAAGSPLRIFTGIDDVLQFNAGTGCYKKWDHNEVVGTEYIIMVQNLDSSVADAYARINGADASVDSSDETNALNVGSDGSGFWVGSDRGLNWKQVNIGEIIIYGKALSLSEIQQVEAYLAARWNISIP